MSNAAVGAERRFGDLVLSVAYSGDAAARQKREGIMRVKRPVAAITAALGALLLTPAGVLAAKLTCLTGTDRLGRRYGWTNWTGD